MFGSSVRVVCGAVLAGLVSASAALAQSPVTYTCALTSSQAKAWIPEVLFIGHDAAKGRVVVSDPLVLRFNDRQPVMGRVSVDNANRITFAWEYAATDPRGNRATMLFRATWLKSAKTMKISAQPVGYAKGFFGQGSCTTESL